MANPPLTVANMVEEIARTACFTVTRNHELQTVNEALRD
jgi:hypothetical protein